MWRLLLVVGLILGVSGAVSARAEDVLLAELDKTYAAFREKEEAKHLAVPRAAVDFAGRGLTEAKAKKHLNKAVEKYAIDQAEKHLAEAKAALAKAESQLRKFPVIQPGFLVRGELGYVAMMQGSRSTLCKVCEIIDADNMLVQTVDGGKVLWVYEPTEGLADDAYFKLEKPYAVTGTRMRYGSTYFFLTPYTPPAERKK